jgi:hypothetical protein
MRLVGAMVFADAGPAPRAAESGPSDTQPTGAARITVDGRSKPAGAAVAAQRVAPTVSLRTETEKRIRA